MRQSDELKQRLAVLKGAIAQARRLLRQLKLVRRSKPVKAYCLLVLNDLTRKCESIVAMAENKSQRGIDIVARSCLESYVDLINLFQFGDEYTVYMQWRSNRQQISSTQPFVQRRSKISDTYEKQAQQMFGKSLAGELEDIKSETALLEQKMASRYRDRNGKVQRRDRLRFELAQRDEEYDSVYRTLSFAVHGNVAGMLEGIADRGTVHWPPREPANEPIASLNEVCRILLTSTRRLARRYKKPVAPINRLIRHLGEISRK